MSAQAIPGPSLPPVPQPSPSVITPAPPRISVQEYLESERHSDQRHEYMNGEILAMAGETPMHNRLARNICVRLERAFEDRPCETFIENIKVRVTPTQYRYPDVVALCGEGEFDNERPPALLNPSVIIEALSPSTEGFGNRGKFVEYRRLKSVTDYVLVAQDEILVIHYARQSPTQWTLTEHTALSETLTFASLDVSLTLGDIYRKIPFEANEPPV